MAKSNDEVEIDPDLEAGLQRAKKSACHYAIITKGVSVLKVIVQKKPIKDGELQKARTEVKGTAAVRGVCKGDGASMTFQVVGEDPGIKPLALKDYLKEAGGATFKVEFQVVKALDDVVDDEAVGQGTGTSVPPPPPAPPPPTELSADAKAILAKLREMGKSIQAAGAANPSRVSDLAKSVETIRKLATANNVKEAMGTLKQLAGLVKELTAASSSSSPPTTAPSQSDATPQQANSQQANSQESESSEDDVEAQRWQQEFDAIQDQYLKAVAKAPSDLAGKLRAVQGYVSEQGANRQYNKARQGLSRLLPLIEQALAIQGPGGASLEIAEGIVKKRKFLATRWSVIPREIKTNLKALRPRISQLVPEEDPNDLVNAIETELQDFYDEMREAIDASINSGDGNYKAALDVIADFRGQVSQHKLIKHLKNNTLKVEMLVEDILLNALNEVQQNLSTAS